MICQPECIEDVLAGKMFRSSDLPFVINYYCMFYTNQPVDWLLPRIIATKLCRLDIDVVSAWSRVQRVLLTNCIQHNQLSHLLVP